MQRILFSHQLREHHLLNYSTRRPAHPHHSSSVTHTHTHNTTHSPTTTMAEDTTNNNNTRTSSGTATTARCGIVELVIFAIAIVSGTACSICSKTMMELQGTNMHGETETFVKPIFQTFGMFVGMMFGMVMHWIVLIFKIPFPGYIHADTATSNTSIPPTAVAVTAARPSGSASTTTATTAASSTTYIAPLKKQGVDSQHHHQYGAITVNNNVETNPLLLRTPAAVAAAAAETSAPVASSNTTPVWMYFFLIIPSIFDLAATAFCMMGLRYIDVSIYLLLRGSGIIFVALMKQHVLGDALYLYQWMGVFWNVIAVILVGSTAILNSHTEQSHMQSPSEALLGVSLILVGAFVQALQFVFEEKVMNMEDASVPPLLLIGMEGIWGTLLCLTVVYPIVYYIPGDDNGSYENPFDTYEMFIQTPQIQFFFVIYFFAIFGYNLFAVLVTFLLNSVWHAILDNFRPISAWIVDLAIFYCISASHGEPWTQFSLIQLLGMLVLLYGTAIYNAPHAGSILLQGQWYSFGINLQREYDAVQHELHEAEMHADWEQKRQSFRTAGRLSSLAERSPMISVHTQALRGLASHNV